MDYDTVALDEERHALAIIDQTQLPYRTEILYLTTQKEIWNAIYLLQVRGAPAIGVSAAIGIYLAAREIQADHFEEFYRQFQEAKDYLDSSRPTAVNLSWALKRQEQVVLANRERSVPEIVEALHQEALNIREEAGRRPSDPLQCRKAGRREIWDGYRPYVSGTGERLRFPDLCG